MKPRAKIKSWTGLLAPYSVKRLYWKAIGYRSRVEDTYNLAFALRKFFGERVTLRRAEEEIKRALETREERFLELIRTEVYGRPASPYFKLLTEAGCAFGDLRSYVGRHGLEGALEKLASEGVYLTSEEFKGKKEVVRGRLSFRTSPEDFQHVSSMAGFVTQSSGTRIDLFAHLSRCIISLCGRLYIAYFFPLTIFSLTLTRCTMASFQRQAASTIC